jgi:uncharacterized protein (TIGR02594 family)
MAGRPQVSIRLGTSGRADVEKDFAAIGDAGDAQAKRYAASWERATADVEAAQERQAKAALRLQTVSSTPIQQQINAATGVGGQSGNAKASAEALARQLAQAETEARQLIAAIDPLFAATMRYEAQVERINAVKATGQLSEERYQQLLANEKTLLDQATAASQRSIGVRGQQRLGMQQLGFQMNDVASQMAMGTKASVIFAQQSAQTVQALQLMGGEGNKFLNFLKGPWGIALSVAVVALSPLIAKLFEGKDKVGQLVDKMKEQVDQARLNEQANRIWESSIDGLIDKTGKLIEKQKEQLETDRERMAQQLKDLQSSESDATAKIADTKQKLDAAKAELNAAAANYNVSPLELVAGTAQGLSGDAGLELQKLADNVNRLTRDYNEAQVAAGRFHSLVSGQEILIARDNAKALADPLEAIRQKYEGLRRAAEDAAQGNDKLRASLAATEADLDRKEAAEIKAAQDRNKGNGGSAIFDSQIAAYFDTANKYRGLSENKASDRGVLEAFFKEANQDLDPEKVKWCAAFVNAVLAANGVKGTGSLAAKSFLTFGKDDTKSPQKGDIAVVRTGAGDHVGFVDSVDKAGNVKMLAGNTGDKVAEATYSKNQVLGIRRPPTPSEAAANDNKAAADALQATQGFDSDLEKLRQQYLQALEKFNAASDQQATVQLQRVQEQHDAEAKEIASNLAAGKYGDATSDLAITRAKQLQAANDAAAKEKDAAIRLQYSVDYLKQQDSSQEQLTGFKLDDLRYQQSIARTSDQRKRLGDQIIDIEYKEKERHLQYLLALDKLTGNTEDAAKIAAELANMPKEKARDQDANNRDNKSPLQAYFDSLPQNMADVNQSIQNIEVSGLQKFNSELTDALMNSKSLKDLWHNLKGVFHDTAAQILKDLIDLTIKMLIIRPILSALGMSPTPGFATGTEYFAGGRAWVGEHGPEMVTLPRGSKIHSASASSRMAANDAGGPPISITNYNDFRGAEPQAVDAINQRVDALAAAVPGMAIDAWSEATSRGAFRAQRR